MRDATGTNWLSHFLYGTCTILRLQDPESLGYPDKCNSRKRSFFFATRIFEIARSLIYSEPSFLSEPKWIDALEILRKMETEAHYHPKELLFDLLPKVSDLSLRAIRFCEDVAQFSHDEQAVLIPLLAEEGLTLQSQLQRWRVETERWHRASERSAEKGTPDVDLLLAGVYYHAISIYLSGTYDYHIHWTWSKAPCSPILPRSQIERHVSEILRLSRELLNIGVSGVLVFFPLRVAGARAIETSARATILDLLHTTVRRGFVVAEAFAIDLSEVWASQVSDMA